MAKFSKAYATATAGLLIWGASVVESASHAVTASEWLALAGIGVATVAVWAIPNAEG